MVRDFLLSGKFTEPMQFASDYYKAYPKVAFGHWPPLLYVVQGVWMIAFSDSRASVLLELALTSALAAFLLFLVAARYLGTAAGIFGSALLVCLPIVQTYSDEEMAESLLLLSGFAATLFFLRYLEHKHWRDSFWFGIFCSLTILTKGNGWALALIPPVAILLTRDFAALRRPNFWIPVPIVAVFCLPWQVLTLEMAQRGWVGGSKPNLAYTFEAVGQFAVIFHTLVGSAVTLLACLGILLFVVRPLFVSRVIPMYAVMFGLLFSIWIFHSIVPAGVEPRKMIDGLPAVILFALAGGQWLASRIEDALSRRGFTPKYSTAVVAAVVAVLFAVETFAIPREEHYGFMEASQYIENRTDLRNTVILVSSESDGEGLFISELVMRDRRPQHTVLRANKVLSVSDWNGNVSEEFCQSPADVMNFVRRESVRAVVMDSYPARVHYRHNDLIRKAIREYPNNWRLASTFGGGKIQVYEIL